ncbi:hypothetical protein Y1Q_0020431 [Alligator mississippiensis]|uniref:Uncharacterized protein n=1 Tax=Alligator mississippiensis TaxID=8496 RepID=A0A151N6X3_ALLMI|nr:hypothetical protein Y1Q_0020431 [Alligator mississippiensis]
MKVDAHQHPFATGTIRNQEVKPREQRSFHREGLAGGEAHSTKALRLDIWENPEKDKTKWGLEAKALEMNWKTRSMML